MATNGVASAVVAEVKDPAGLGRIQIQLSADAGGAKAWARVVSPLGRSLIAISLDVGDEVMVAFESGDITRPIVLGNLWNGADSPPESADAQKVQLPTGATLHPIVDAGNASTECARRMVDPQIAAGAATGADRIRFFQKPGTYLKAEIRTR